MPTAEYLKAYTQKLSNLSQEISSLESSIKDLHSQWKGLQAKEHTSKGDINTLLHIYEKKRLVRHSLHSQESRLEYIRSLHEKTTRNKEGEEWNQRMFKGLNVNVDLAKEKMKKELAEVYGNPYKDRVVDAKELSSLKYGFPLKDNYGTFSPGANLKKSDRLYDIKAILEEQQKHKKELSLRRLNVLGRHKEFNDVNANRILKIKDLKNKGLYRHEGSLRGFGSSEFSDIMKPFYELRGLREKENKLRKKEEERRALAARVPPQPLVQNTTPTHQDASAQDNTSQGAAGEEEDHNEEGQEEGQEGGQEEHQQEGESFLENNEEIDHAHPPEMKEDSREDKSQAIEDQDFDDFD